MGILMVPLSRQQDKERIETIANLDTTPTGVKIDTVNDTIIGLSLADGVVLTDADYDVYQEYFTKLYRLHVGSAWLLGDMLRIAESSWSERHAQLIPDTDIARQTLKNYAYLCNAYPHVLSEGGYRDLATLIRHNSLDDQHATWAITIADNDTGELTSYHVGMFRRYELTVAHHEAVSSLRGELLNLRAKLLQRAIDERLSASELRLLKNKYLKDGAEGGDKAAQDALTPPAGSEYILRRKVVAMTLAEAMDAGLVNDGEISEQVGLDDEIELHIKIIIKADGVSTYR